MDDGKKETRQRKRVVFDKEVTVVRDVIQTPSLFLDPPLDMKTWVGMSFAQKAKAAQARYYVCTESDWEHLHYTDPRWHAEFVASKRRRKA
jgi:hypothetical protein